MQECEIKDGFVLYHNYSVFLVLLSTTEMGELFEAIFLYEITGKTPDFAGALRMAFTLIRKDLDLDRNDEGIGNR